MPDIRLATPADLPAIQACAKAAYTPYVAAIGKPPAPIVANFPAHVARSEIWVMRIDGALIGYIVFYPRGQTMFLENVAVSPDHEGLGYGKRLIGFCEKMAKRSGCDRILLYTNEKMAANLAIYPHLGYRETHRKSEDGFNRVFFEKRL